MAKQLAEGLADQPTITLELYYMLLSQVEFVRQYHTHECQMVPTTFFRAFTVRTFWSSPRKGLRSSFKISVYTSLLYRN